VEYCKALHDYFESHLRYQEELKDLPDIKPYKLRTAISLDDHAGRLNPLHKYRQFSILVFHNPFAYDTSHHIQLVLKGEPKTVERPEQPEVVISSVAVLKRSNKSRCGNCIGQQEAGDSHVGRLTISPVILTYLLERWNKNDKNASMRDISFTLTGSLRFRVTDAGGHNLAESRPRDEVAGFEGKSPMDKAKVPEFKLISTSYIMPGEAPTDSKDTNEIPDLEQFDQVWFERQESST
jgi:hypothetical protein